MQKRAVKWTATVGVLSLRRWDGTERICYPSEWLSDVMSDDTRERTRALIAQAQRQPNVWIEF